MTAYDYNKQQWVSGEAACAVRLHQLQQELTLLKSDRGAMYLASNMFSDTVPQAIAKVEAEMATIMQVANTPTQS